VCTVCVHTVCVCFGGRGHPGQDTLLSPAILYLLFPLINLLVLERLTASSTLLLGGSRLPKMPA
jgi:hypothetical protein